MPSYIEAGELLMELNDTDIFDTYNDYSMVFDTIDNFPTADVAPVRHGEWVEEDTAITCPICTRSYDTDFEIKRSVVLRFKYCPECGAKMGGENNG